MEYTLVKKLLGDEMAQRDPKFLDYSIKRKDLIDILISSEGFYIVNAARGSGKSGLILSLEKEIAQVYQEKHVVIKKYYSDVVRPKGEITIDEYVNFWKNTILGCIIAEIGKCIGIAISEDSMTAVEHSERQGTKEKNIIASLLARLKITGLPIEKLAFDPTLNDAQFARILGRSSNIFWLLLDEMDDHYRNDVNSNHCLVGLMQACDYLTTKYKNIRIRATVRPHIMTILNTNFDIVQRFRQCEIKISWNQSELKTILANRISYFEGNLGCEQQDLFSRPDEKGKIFAQNLKDEEDCKIISKYFDDFDMKFTREGKSKFRALHTVSMGRPRWMIEFCSISLCQAGNSNFASINSLKKAMYEYGNNRIKFAVGEHRFQFPYLDAVLNHMVGFRRVKYGTSNDLKKFLIEHVIDEGVFHKEGQNKSRLALEIAQALFLVGFIRAKKNLGGKDDHRFYSFNDRPDLLASWGLGNKFTWELHPVFARGLHIEETNMYISGAEIRLLGGKHE